MGNKHKENIITFDANKLLKPFLKDCLRVIVTNLSIDVLKAENTPSEFIINDLYHTAIDTSIIFKAILGMNRINTKLLVKSLKVIHIFSKEVAMLKNSPVLNNYGYNSDEIKFEFYKISANAERVAYMLENNFSKRTGKIQLSEHNLFLRSMEEYKAKEERSGSYFIDVNELECEDEAEKVNIKYIIGDNLFETLFKMILTGVVKDILSSKFKFSVDTSLIESARHLCTLYNLRLVYRKDEKEATVKMLTFALKSFENLREALEDDENELPFTDDEVDNFFKCERQSKKLLNILKKRDLELEDGYVPLTLTLRRLLKEQIDEKQG